MKISNISGLPYQIISCLTPLRSVITHGPYTSGTVSRRISTKTALILMMAISYSYLMRVFMNAFEMSTVATYRCSSVSTMHVSRNDLVENFGGLASSLDMKSLCLLPHATFLTFSVTSLFYLRKRLESRIVFLYYFKSISSYV